MKKFTSCFTYVMVVCLLVAAIVPTIRACAVENDDEIALAFAFVPSAYQKGTSVSDSYGRVVIDGEEIPMEELAAHDLQLVFTSIESVQNAPKSHQQLMQDAYNALNKAENFGDLNFVADSKSVAEVLKDAGQENVDLLLVSDVMDAAVTKLGDKDDVVECTELEFKVFIDYASRVALALRYLESGEWEVIDVTKTVTADEKSVVINGDGNGVYVMFVTPDVSGENRLNLFN